MRNESLEIVCTGRIGISRPGYIADDRSRIKCNIAAVYSKPENRPVSNPLRDTRPPDRLGVD